MQCSAEGWGMMDILTGRIRSLGEDLHSVLWTCDLKFPSGKVAFYEAIRPVLLPSSGNLSLLTSLIFMRSSESCFKPIKSPLSACWRVGAAKCMLVDACCSVHAAGFVALKMLHSCTLPCTCCLASCVTTGSQGGGFRCRPCEGRQRHHDSRDGHLSLDGA